MRKIKSFCLTFLAIFCFLGVLTVCQFQNGDSLVFAGTKITQENINFGLWHCMEYPVGLSFEGNTISFDAKDVPPVIITPDGEENGYTLIPARALFEKMGAAVSWNNDERAVIIKLEENDIKLVIESDTAKVNGEDRKLDVPALIIDHDGDYYGSTMIPVRFVAEALGCKVTWDNDTRMINVTMPEKKTEENQENKTEDKTYGELPKLCEEAKDKLIIIDSGHGGSDPGAIGHEKKSDELREKTINLAVALKLNEYLKEAGFSTYMLKETDKTINIYTRPAMANEAEGDFFVSIHNNSATNSTSNGTTTIYSSKVYYGMNDDGRAVTMVSKAIELAASNPAISFDLNGTPVGITEEEGYGITSKEVAKSVQSELVKILGTHDCGTKDNNSYIVLNSTKMPAIIIEGAFLSNEADFQLMNSEDYAGKYAYAAAKGIIKAFNERFSEKEQ